MGQPWRAELDAVQVPVRHQTQSVDNRPHGWIVPLANQSPALLKLSLDVRHSGGTLPHQIFLSSLISNQMQICSARENKPDGLPENKPNGHHAGMFPRGNDDTPGHSGRPPLVEFVGYSVKVLPRQRERLDEHYRSPTNTTVAPPPP